MNQQQRQEMLNRYYANLLANMEMRIARPPYTGPLKELSRVKRFALVLAWLLCIVGILRGYGWLLS
jgi:hypothetical protein